MNMEIEELLPFYVNGTLAGEELKRVEQALRDDPSLADEIEFLKKLQQEIKTEHTDQPPGELGLKRLQKQIQEQANNPSANRNRLHRNKFSENKFSGNKLWHFASMAACLLLIIQTIAFLPHWPTEDLTAAGNSTTGHPWGIHTPGKVISITFVPDATEENIRQLLLAIDANIVEGPTALGIYKIVVNREVEPAIEKLKAHKNLIESVQHNVITQ